MARYIPDIQTHRWVIMAPGRTQRPKEKLGAATCVFCYGAEHMSNTEVYRLGEGAPNSHGGWKVRVIANKYPITDIHEVIIHSPDEDKDMDELALEQVNTILQVYRSRYQLHSTKGQVLIFCNHGEDAGASIHHPHAQLVVLPEQINVDALSREPFANEVQRTDEFVVYCPEFSQWPYETWIAPTSTGTTYGEMTDSQLFTFAKTLQWTLKRLVAHLTSGDVHHHPGVPSVSKQRGLSYNYYLYHGKDWFLRIIPRLVHRAGFELGTGLSVNIVDPSKAAEILRARG